MHYHIVNVFDAHKKLIETNKVCIDDLLIIPKIDYPNWTKQEIQLELDNIIQGILGYVVRWVDQGVGCSKVPDINDIGLMEDRATCRISSQHLANWLHHNIITKDQMISSLKKMAKIVDTQNENDVNYKKMSENYDGSLAFQAALDLVLKGTRSPSGYTEPLLHSNRIIKKTI